MRKELALLGALIVVVVLLASAVKVFEAQTERGDSVRFVLSDLQDKYPGADTEIIKVEERLNPDGEPYFYIKARVTREAAGACPERVHVYYHYPEQNFETEPPEYAVIDCRVCSQQPCVLVYPEEAIIASHTLEGSEHVREFIALFPTAYPVVEETLNGWSVVWDSPISTHYYLVEVNREGQLDSVTRVQKEP